MANWHVESFHINVGVGDCAIHLLISDKDTVRAAVLVDGGTAHNNRQLNTLKLDDDSAFRRMVTRINRDYEFEQIGGDPEQLTFDSIVVSHWDEDHYGGLVKTLREDAAAAHADKTTIPYLKWSKDKPPLPRTYLFAPNKVGKIPKGKGGTDFNGLPKKFRHKEVDGEDWIEINIEQKKTKDPDFWFRFAKLRTADMDDRLGIYAVLGRNFFNTSGLQTKPTDKHVASRSAQN